MFQQVFAQTELTASPVTAVDNLGDIFGLIINIILGIGWALTFVMLALGLVQYVMSKGETKATDAARNWLTAAAIGGVGLFFLTALRSILTGLIGANNTSIGNSSIDPFN